MPCDQIQEVTLDFGKADTAIMKMTLEGLGWKVHSLTAKSLSATKGNESLTFANGEFSVRNSDRYTGSTSLDLAEVKRNYSKQTVNFAAKKFGWNVKWESEFKAKVIKRGF